jgi:hypothetical protein
MTCISVICKCSADISGICVSCESLSCYSFYLKWLVRILKWHLLMLSTRNCCGQCILLNHLARDCSLLTAISQDIRFGIKVTFSYKIEIIDGSEGLTYIHIHFISQIQNALVKLNIKFVSNTYTERHNIQHITVHNTYH